MEHIEIEKLRAWEDKQEIMESLWELEESFYSCPVPLYIWFT